MLTSLCILAYLNISRFGLYYSYNIACLTTIKIAQRNAKEYLVIYDYYNNYFIWYSMGRCHNRSTSNCHTTALYLCKTNIVRTKPLFVCIIKTDCLKSGTKYKLF